MSRLIVLVMHLLKWRYQPTRQSRSWQHTIGEQRKRLTRLLRDTPSLQPLLTTTLTEAYPQARARALAETRLPDAALPLECPWTVAQILDESFWQEE